MREIKFRAYVKKDGRYKGSKMYSWDEIKASIDEECGWYKSIFSIGCDLDEENIVIMQFTGLLDNQGKDIYEGDIVLDDKGNIDEVVFSRGSFGVTDIDYVDPDVNIDLTEEKSIEVIGNIYEHLTLLKDTQ